jgi:hypothetical protein
MKNGGILLAILAREVIKEKPKKSIDALNHGAKQPLRDPMTQRGIASVPPYTNVRIKIARRAARNVERSYLDLMLGNAMNLRVRVESGKSIVNLPIHWHLPESV